MASKRIHYGWVIALAGAGIQSAQALSIYSFGIFLRPLTLEFGWERGALSLASSLAGVEMGFLAIVTGKLSDKYGPRILVTLGSVILGTGFLLMTQVRSLIQVYIVWGLCMGLAASCFVVPIISTIPRWFVQKRGIAISIPVTGFGLGAIVSPLLAQMLISAYGWQRSFLILGVIAWAITIPLSQFMRQSPAQMGLRPYGEHEDAEDKKSLDSNKELSLAETLRGVPFWVIGAMQVLWFFCLQVIVVHIAAHASDSGIPEMVAASILSFVAGTSVIGRLSMGLMSDKLGSRRALSLCLILSTLALVWLLLAKEIWAFYLFAVIFGLAYGGIVTLLTVVPSELFGMKSLGVILGALMLFSTIGSASGAPVAGYIFDTTGSYHLALVILVIFCAVTAVLGLALLRYKVKEA